MKTIKHWVGGEYYEGSPLGVIPVENPATGEVTAELLQASKEDLDHTVEVAREAQKEWASYSLSKRVAIMFRMRQLVLDHQDEMARLIVKEHGKNYSDAIGEIQRGRETLDFATAINVALKGEYSHDVSTGVDIHTTRQPVGVVAGICPFNFPAMVPMWMHRRHRFSRQSCTRRLDFPTVCSTCSRAIVAVSRTSWSTRVLMPSPSLVRPQWLTSSKTPA